MELTSTVVIPGTADTGQPREDGENDDAEQDVGKIMTINDKEGNRKTKMDCN